MGIESFRNPDRFIHGWIPGSHLLPYQHGLVKRPFLIKAKGNNISTVSRKLCREETSGGAIRWRRSASYHTFKVVTDENGKEKWKTIHRGKLINHPDIEIIAKFNAEIRGLYNYYRLANNVSVLGKFAFIMEYSMYKTFACKYRSTVRKIIDRFSHNRRFAVAYETKAGTKYCEFYHDGFKRIKETLPQPDTLPEYSRRYENPNSNAARLKRGVCELCGLKTNDPNAPCAITQKTDRRKRMGNADEGKTAQIACGLQSLPR